MKPTDDIKNMIKKMEDKTSKQMDTRILDDILQTLDKSYKTQTPIGRFIMKNPIIKIAAAAVIIISISVFLHFTGGPSITSAAFGKAIDYLRNAETVSFRMSIEKEGQKPQISHIWTLEPNHQRTEMEDGRIFIVDTYQGKSIVLYPTEKNAYVMNTIVSPKETLNLYDSFKKILFEDAEQDSLEYLGESQINGQKVVGFRAKQEFSERIVWADAVDSIPIRIEFSFNDRTDNQNNRNTRYTISDIVLGENLDESLFSLSVPEDYSQIVTTEPVVEEQREMMQRLNARILQKLVQACYKYSTEHDGIWPENLRQAIEYGIEDESLLNLTDPELELGCVYIRPSKSDPRLIQIYQNYDVWPEGGIIVGFSDCFIDQIKDEETFIKHLEYTVTVNNEN